MSFECWHIAVVVVVVAIAIVGPMLAPGNPIPTTLEGAILSITRLEEWSKWMAGIVTAALGGLVYLVFNEKRIVVPTYGWEPLFVLAAAVCLGLALVSVASIFSSLSSLSIRIYNREDPSLSVAFDIYEARMFASTRVWLPMKLGVLLAIHHYLWVVGLLALGCYVLSRLVTSRDALALQ
jgi:hypothetical protein